MDKQESTSAGIGFFGLLTIAFIVLKLCDIINWGWLWVLAPTWIPFGIYLLVFIIIIVTLGIARYKDRKNFNKLNKK